MGQLPVLGSYDLGLIKHCALGRWVENFHHPDSKPRGLGPATQCVVLGPRQAGRRDWRGPRVGWGRQGDGTASIQRHSNGNNHSRREMTTVAS